MPTHKWARHPDAIEDARDDQDTALVSRAVRWAIATERPEAVDLLEALADVFYTQGNRNAASCVTNRAIEIALDAYLEDQQARRDAA